MKLLRVALPLGVALVPGARIVIDENEAMTAPYVVCLPKNGCMADYKADTDLIEKLKKGRNPAIQALDRGRLISFTFSLNGFANAHDGPAGDPTDLNELRQAYRMNCRVIPRIIATRPTAGRRICSAAICAPISPHRPGHVKSSGHTEDARSVPQAIRGRLYSRRFSTKRRLMPAHRLSTRG
jgi:hypothetical protein